MPVVSLLLLGFVLRTVVSVRSLLTGLTARSATGWAIPGCLTAMLSAGLQILPDVPAGVQSAVHSLAATLLLAPLLDILGARNPGHRAWPWFVVTPMILVLQWPTISHLLSERPETPLTTPLPATIGFLLVLVMGSGNYFGTTNTSACLFGAVGVFLFALPVTEWWPWPGQGICLAGTVCLAITALLAEGRLKSSPAATGHQQLWADFRDIYGLVWARRVMDRINQFADRERWDVVMTLEGFRPRDQSSGWPDSMQRPEEILRWVLRRFADEAFLLSRMPTESKPADSQAADN